METLTLPRKTKAKKAVATVRRGKKAEAVKAVAPVKTASKVTRSRAQKKAEPVAVVEETLVVTAEPRNELAKAIEERRLKEEAEARARALFGPTRKVFFAEDGFMGAEPEAILQLDTRIRHAIADAEHGWMFDKMVHSVQVGAAQGGSPRYYLEQIDPRRSTGVAFSVFLDIAPGALGGLVEEAGEGMERYYSPDVLLEYRIMTAMERMEHEGVRFAGDSEAWRAVNAHDELEYLRKLREAFALFSADERSLLADLVVTPPTEGKRFFGFRIGRRAARIQDGAFLAPVDVSEESIFDALMGEVEKRKRI
jgi:hypothetical protein